VSAWSDAWPVPEKALAACNRAKRLFRDENGEGNSSARGRGRPTRGLARARDRRKPRIVSGSRTANVKSCRSPWHANSPMLRWWCWRIMRGCSPFIMDMSNARAIPGWRH